MTLPADDEPPVGGAKNIFSSLFGPGSTANQFLLWSVLSVITSAALAPALSDITQFVNSADPVNPLTPEQLAVATVREIITENEAAGEAAKSGIGPGRFSQLIDLAQSPPALSLFFAAYQRSQGAGGLGGGMAVDFDTVLADLGISAQYRPMVKALAISIPDASQVLLAWLTGQITEDEARGRLLATGMDPTWIDSAYNAEGQAPTPNELLDLWNRGAIPEGGTGAGVVSYDQGFLEGPWRNKWAPAFKTLRLYYPPPRTTQAMLREGTINVATATLWLGHYGVEGDVLTAFLANASHAATVEQRELSKTEIIDLYSGQLITAAQAVDDLKALNYTAADAALIIALADQKKATAATKAGVTRLQHLYLAGTNTAAQTKTALTALGIGDAQAANLLASWDLEQAAVVKTLTAAQIETGWHFDVIGTAEALNRLVALGYSRADAELLLAIRNHAALTPAQLAT